MTSTDESPAGPPSTLTFGGTATTLLRLGGFTVLTDPNFLHRGQWVHLGYGLRSKRLTEPAIGPDDLPPLDAVLLSHLHGDHFDGIARRRLDRTVPIVTTRAAARRLTQWGFTEATGLRTWETWQLRRGDEVLRVTSAPGQHGPAVVHRALPPVMGSVVDLLRGGRRVLRLYLTGDTLFRPYLGEVRERAPGIDAMVAHLGGTKVLGVLVTMDGTQGADLLELVDARTVVPVHHDDYGVFRSPRSDFEAEVHRRGLTDRLRLVERGQTLTL
jgi:L-ascorbate metabolism protein UlaG (beta-lactamase superfamily)